MQAEIAPNDPILDYPQRVLAGEIAVGKLVRLACERSMRDIERAQSDVFSWRWRYDPARAEHAITFIQNMTMTTGSEFQGLPLELSPWQKWIAASVYGWVDAEGKGIRRFRRAYVEVPRKNGKTEFMGGVGLYHLCDDGEKKPEVVCAATTYDQAKILYERCTIMVAIEPDLREAFELATYGTVRNGGEIIEGKTLGVLKPLTSDKGGSQDGQSISCGLIDELHAHKNADTWHSVTQGTGSRKNPMVWVITTAGDDINGICYEQHKLIESILNRKNVDAGTERYFGVIYAADAKDDPFDIKTWEKANPNLGVSVTLDSMEVEATAARNSASLLNAFKTKRLDIWIQDYFQWMNMQTFAKCKRRSTWETYRGCDVYIGMDLSSKTDITSLCYLFVNQETGEVHAKWRNYLPEDALESSKNADNYKAWAENDELTLIDGAQVNYDVIFEQLEKDIELFNVLGIGYDPNKAYALMNKIDNSYYDVPLVEVKQYKTHLTEPTKQWEADVISGNFTHDGNACSVWMVGNAVAKVDSSSDYVKLERPKLKPENKIDGAAGCVFAYRLHITPPEQLAPMVQSLYTDEELARMRGDESAT